MKQRLTALCTALAILATVACGGHGGGATPPTGGTPFSPYTGPAALANFDWGKEQLQGAMLEGPASLGHMQVTVVLKQQNATGLVAYAQQASDPSSPLYRHFLTPQQIGTQFGATRQDYQAAADYFVSQGLNVAGWPQHLSLSVAGSQTAMERAFGTKFGVYQKDGFHFVAPMSAPHFNSVVPVAAVSNLVALNRKHTYFIQAPPRANAGDNVGYSPQQVRNAFDFTGAYSKGYDGNGITVGIIGTGPINVDRTSGAAGLCSEKDLAALRALYNNVNVATVCEADVTPSGVAAGLNAPPSPIPTAIPASPNPLGTPAPNPGQSPTSMFPYSGSFQTPPPVTAGNCSGTLPTCNPEDGEAQLDVQQVATLAPGASVKFYLAYNANDCYVFFPNTCAPAPTATATPANSNYGYPQIGIIEADAEIEQAIADNSADVISISYGGGESQTIGAGFNANGIGYQPEEYAALAAEGVAVFVSSGDSGSAECLGTGNTYQAKVCVSYPSGDLNVTSVGGVNAPINEFGQLSANITTWGNTNGGYAAPGSTASGSGSGGGISTIFPAPSWQKSAINATFREQPDVSMIGDPLTGVTAYANSGLTGSANVPSGAFPVGGTSVAAPQMAAMWALVLTACKATPACQTGPAAHPYRLGNAAPYFYQIYKQTATGAAPPVALPYPQVFYDVVYGENAVNNPAGGTATPVPGQVAGTGYDLTTGVGVPFAGHLIQAVTGKVVP